MSDEALASVMRVGQLEARALSQTLARFGLQVERIPEEQSIPGSYWGESEAGLRGAALFVRDTTPVHSALHEASHYICMDERRRAQLDRDAGGEYDEENAVCYLQILLADHLPNMDGPRMMRDMDAWGYTFRLGSARAWFEQDADDARAWLLRAGLIDERRQVTFAVRR